MRACVCERMCKCKCERVCACSVVVFMCARSLVSTRACGGAFLRARERVCARVRARKSMCRGGGGCDEGMEAGGEPGGRVGGRERACKRGNPAKVRVI